MLRAARQLSGETTTISELTGIPTLACLENFGPTRRPSEQIRAVPPSQSAIPAE